MSGAAYWFSTKASGTSAPGTFFVVLNQSHVGPAAGETGIAAPNRTPGIFSDLMIRVTTNDRTAGSTYSFRSGGADGTQSVSVPAGATGDFRDATGIDAVAGAGELINTKLVVGTGGTSFIWALVGAKFRATTDQVAKYEALGNAQSLSTGTAYFTAIASLGGSDTTENREQFKFKTAGVLKNFFALVSTNTLNTAATTVRTRKNTANGGMSVSVPAGATGTFEDISNTDTIAVDDLVDIQWSVASGGTGNLSMGSAGFDFVSTNGKYHLAIATSTGQSFSLNTTTYIAPGGSIVAANTTEDNVKALAGLGATLSNLEAFVSANTITATTTLRTRKNGANGAQALSIPSSTTGYFEDTSNTDLVLDSDYFNYQLVVPNNGTSIRVNNVGVLVAPTVSNIPRSQMRRTLMPLLGR